MAVEVWNYEQVELPVRLAFQIDGVVLLPDGPRNRNELATIDLEFNGQLGMPDDLVCHPGEGLRRPNPRWMMTRTERPEAGPLLVRNKIGCRQLDLFEVCLQIFSKRWNRVVDFGCDDLERNGRPVRERQRGDVFTRRE